MWLALGIVSIVFAILNVVYTSQNKNTKWFRFLSLSFTALTVCSFYADGAARVANEDWGGLMDTMPTMSKALWICVILSIAINSISLFKGKK
jgi:formate hydrogenlyase subunit 3/multisubunit Na+/H+ antiporter MnhD subunit